MGPHAVERIGAPPVRISSERHEPRWLRYALAAALLLLPIRGTLGPVSWHLQWSDVAAIGFLAGVAWAGRRWSGKGGRLWGWAAGYLVALVPSFFNTTELNGSVVELMKTGYVIGLGLAIARWIRSPATWDWVAATYAAGAGAVVFLTLGVWLWVQGTGRVPSLFAVAMSVPNVGEVVRMQATFLTPSMLANYLTASLPILAVYAARRSSRPRLVCWVLLLAGVLAACTTFSHSIAGCLVAAAMVAPRSRRAERFGAAVLSLLAAAAVVVALFSTTVAVHRWQVDQHPATAPITGPTSFHLFPGPQGSGEELHVTVSYSRVSYGLLKGIAWEAWGRHPWVGGGLGTFPQAVAAAFRAGRIHYTTADPHSTWWGALAETGLIGTLGLLLWWSAVIRLGRRADQHTPHRWRVVAPLAGLVGLLVNSPHVDIMHFRFLWVAVALLASGATLQAPRSQVNGRFAHA